MPSFHISDADARAVAHFFAAKAWGEHDERLTLWKNALDKAEEDANRLQDKDDAKRSSELKRIKTARAALAREQGLYANPFPFEKYEEGTQAYQAEREREKPRYYAMARALVKNKDVSCIKCHFVDGKAPDGEKADWAPDLIQARQRLRPQWIERWITKPSRVLPGTTMPDFDWSLFDGDFPGTDEERARALKDLLFVHPELVKLKRR